MAFEALSLAFHPVHVLEVDGGRLSHLNAEKKRWDYDLQIHKRDARRAAPLILRETKSIVFLDPPYSFWNRTRSEAVDRLLWNLIHGSAKEKETGPVAQEIWLIVHGP